MTIIERILLEVSAKVDDGKPNFKNKEHIVILSEVLTNLGWTIKQKSELIGNLTGTNLIKEMTVKQMEEALITASNGSLGTHSSPRRVSNLKDIEPQDFVKIIKTAFDGVTKVDIEDPKQVVTRVVLSNYFIGLTKVNLIGVIWQVQLLVEERLPLKTKRYLGCWY